MRIPDVIADRVPWILVGLLAGKLRNHAMWYWAFEHSLRAGIRATMRKKV